MTVFFQAAALVLLAVILSLTLNSTAKSTACILVMTAGVLVLGSVFYFLESIFSFLEELRSLASLNGDMLRVLCKCVGISMVSEIITLVCADSGNTSLAKSLQILSVCVILWLSLPLFQELIRLISGILEAV